MSPHLLITLLTSGLVTFSCCGNYEYHLIKVSKAWEEAQEYCRSNYVDLATFSDTDDMEQAAAVAAAGNVNSEMWIGLKETGPASWLWSTSMSPAVEDDEDNWAASPAATHHCAGVTSDGKWLSELCSTARPFICQGDEASPELHLLLQTSTWRKAQDYCRQHHHDLACIRTAEQTQALQEILNVSQSPAVMWVGLFRDEWTWSDQSSSTFRYWQSTQPNNDGKCTLFSGSSKIWFDRQCTRTFPFLCYKFAQPQQTVRTVRMKIESQTLIDFNDPTVSEALLTQFQSKLEGFKLQWRVQPDGKIFHREDKESNGC